MSAFPCLGQVKPAAAENDLLAKRHESGQRVLQSEKTGAAAIQG